MKFYKAKNGQWYGEEKFWEMANIFKYCFHGSLSLDMECGYDADIVRLTCDEVKVFDGEPSVIDYLKMDMHADAVLRYYHIHEGTTLREARDMVDKIEKDMEVAGK